MREINVWGATHSNEWQSLALIYDLRRTARHHPGLPVHAFIPHNSDWGGFYRGGEHDLVLGMAGGSQGAHGPIAPYVRQRAARMRARSRGAYANIDVHQITTYGLRTAYIDIHKGVSPTVLGFLKQLGMTSLVGTEGFGLQACVKNSFELEATYETGRQRQEIMSAIRRLSSDPAHPVARADEFDWYKYVGLLDNHTYPYGTRRSHAPGSHQELKALQQLPESVAVALGIGGMAVRVLNWREDPMKGSDGIWGEVVTRMVTPDTTQWPSYQEELTAASAQS